jgi:hypothetical protein
MTLDGYKATHIQVTFEVVKGNRVAQVTIRVPAWQHAVTGEIRRDAGSLAYERETQHWLES